MRTEKSFYLYRNLMVKQMLHHSFISNILLFSSEKRVNISSFKKRRVINLNSPSFNLTITEITDVYFQSPSFSYSLHLPKEILVVKELIRSRIGPFGETDVKRGRN